MEGHMSTCRRCAPDHTPRRTTMTFDLRERLRRNSGPQKNKDPSGGTTGRVKPYGRLGWMGARARYSPMGRDYRSHIHWSRQGRRTFKAACNFFYLLGSRTFFGGILSRRRVIALRLGRLSEAMAAPTSHESRGCRLGRDARRYFRLACRRPRLPSGPPGTAPRRPIPRRKHRPRRRRTYHRGPVPRSRAVFIRIARTSSGFMQDCAPASAPQRR